MKIDGLKMRPDMACRRTAFSLLEVMIASAIFFTATFAILELVSVTLRNARAIQQNDPDLAMLAGQLALTNVLTEDTDSGDFGHSYPGYTWSRDVYQVQSNHLFEADFTVHRKLGRNDVQSHLSVYFYKPASTEYPPKGSLQ